MSARLVLGPILRYTGEEEATVWVETSASCEVEVLGARSPTFEVGGHHYALILITGLEPGKTYEYGVTLDGIQAWPEPDDPFPPPVIRTLTPDGRLKLSFGSCRVSVPHEPPYTLDRRESKHGYGEDALYALASRMRRQPAHTWPDALLLLGDQIYADDVSEGTRKFIHSRRDPQQSPGEEVADFEEYTHLYKDSWGDPAIRWLLSTVPSAMIFDDHDVNDDWNTSWAWVRQMRENSWWQERIIGAFVSYWIYQHLGNLSPSELEEDALYQRVKSSRDATHLLREFACMADRDPDSARWSYHRDFGRVRLIVMDSRAGRVLSEESRSMIDSAEWEWIEEHASGEFDHLLLGTSLPAFMASGLHRLEAWNEAVCDGVWGASAARLGERLRQALDLEHWAAFHDSFEALVGLLRSVAEGRRSPGLPPASVALLSGDVHHGYLAEAELGDGAVSRVYQAVCSPMRNHLGPSGVVGRK